MFFRYINIFLYTIILIIVFNFFLGFLWKIISYKKIKYLEPYDEIILKSLDLNKEEGKILYLETWINRKFKYDQYTEHAEDFGYKNQFVNVTPEKGRKTITPLDCSNNIIFYGGSTVFGYNVIDNQTIPSYFGDLLIKNNQKYCVKNFGRSYYFSTQENILFKKHILANKINEGDIIVFIDCINESGNKYSRNTRFLYDTFDILNQKPWDMYKISFVNFLNSLTLNQLINKFIVEKNQYITQQQSIFNIENKEYEVKQVFQKNIFFREGICEKIGLKCFNFLQPFATLHGKYFDKPINGANENRVLNIDKNLYLKKKFDLLKTSKGIIDLSEALRNHNLLSYIDEIHYSPDANKKIAQFIYKYIYSKID